MAMQRFLLRLFVFLAPCILLSYPLDLLISSKLAQAHGYPGEIEVWKAIEDEAIDADVAIYGSSRAWVHVDPELIGQRTGLKAYNLGIDGYNFHLQFLRHLKYKQSDRRPSLIILSVDVFTWDQRADLYELRQFLPFMLFDRQIQAYTSEYEGFHWAEHWIPLVRYLGRNDQWVEQVKARPGAPFRNKGYRAMERTWNADLAKARREMGSYTAVVRDDVVDLFVSFLRECARDGIEVVLVYTPEHVEGQQFVTNRAGIIAAYEAIAAQQDLLFLDYSGDPMCLDKDLFYNASHLNAKGSRLFTAKLVRDLQERGVLPVAP